MNVLKNMFDSGNKKIEEADKECDIARQKFAAIANPIEAKQEQILNKFQEIIEGDDRGRYDQVWYDEDGITMRIDADHPNDIRDTTWSWDEAETILLEYSLNLG